MKSVRISRPSSMPVDNGNQMSGSQVKEQKANADKNDSEQPPVRNSELRVDVSQIKTIDRRLDCSRVRHVENRDAVKLPCELDGMSADVMKCRRRLMQFVVIESLPVQMGNCQREKRCNHDWAQDCRLHPRQFRRSNSRWTLATRWIYPPAAANLSGAAAVVCSLARRVLPKASAYRPTYRCA